MAACATRLVGCAASDDDAGANANGSDDASISSSSSSGSSSSPRSRQRLQHGSPKQGSKFVGKGGGGGGNGHADDAVFNLGSIPHHFTAFSVSNAGAPAPTVTVHCLDYVL